VVLPRGVHKKAWKLAYRTAFGHAIQGESAGVLSDPGLSVNYGTAQLIFTSPPFPLRTKKSYGNFTGDEYVEWLAAYGALFKRWLAPTGSIVIEIGNAWEAGRPTMSTLPTKALLRFQEANELYLCQEFICHNPARLPTPAQWVTVKRVRVKDSFTKVWWLSPTPHPKANNRHVLQEYSDDMKRLLATRKYNAGKRPSQHHVGKSSFLSNNAGAIPPSVLTIANTRAGDDYQRYCAEKGHELHPARMPRELAEFFIRFLTSPGDLVIDPFAGSNTTGAVAERLGRRWLAIEANESYIRGSRGRFGKKNTVPA
jgi:DNA modification methylase